MTSWSYEETLNYLFSQLPMFQRVGPIAFKKDLGNITQLCQHLGQPQEKYPTIHIAGTNGKGSTAHLISAILQANGLKVGLYTSPHYKDFRERIKIDGVFIPPAKVVEFVADHRTFFEAIKPSFFEITVAMAFQYFAQEKVDVAVIETGLGGRLDSTNIVQPLLSIITNISLDHQNFLGDTLVEIAGEKAGIIKPKTPVLIGQTQTAVKAVFLEKATAEEAPIYFADQYFQLSPLQHGIDYTLWKVLKKDEVIHEQLKVNLVGDFQQYNIVTALMAAELLKELLPLDLATIPYALAHLKSLTRLMGRWEVLDQNPLIITDSAHNEAGVDIVLKSLEQFSGSKLHMVWGMVKDKTIEKILEKLPKEAVYYFCKPKVPRGMEVEVLAQKANQFGLVGEHFSSVDEALNAAKKAAKAADVIYVGGSTFVVAEVL